MSQSHYKVFAKTHQELRVRGDYFEIEIVNVVLDAGILPDSYTQEVQHCILFEVICSNLWDYVVPTNLSEPLLVDSDGFQHSVSTLSYDAVVSKSKSLKEGMALPIIASEILGKAKSRGWIAFPKLKKGVVPQRLVFQFQIFDPGCTSGQIQHIETLELIFVLSLYGRLINEGKTSRSKKFS